jgi:hypothetical protein
MLCRRGHDQPRGQFAGVAPRRFDGFGCWAGSGWIVAGFRRASTFDAFTDSRTVRDLDDDGAGAGNPPPFQRHERQARDGHATGRREPPSSTHE